MSLVSSVFYADRVNARSWRTFSQAVSQNGTGLSPTLRDEVALPREPWSLRQLCLTWAVPAGALSARLFGQLYVDLQASYDPSHPSVNVHWELRKGAWGAADPGYDPPGTVLASGVSTTPPGQTVGQSTIFNYLEIPVTALGDLQLVFVDTLDFAGDPPQPSDSLATSNIVIPIIARSGDPGPPFQIDFRTEAPVSSSAPRFPGGPGGGNW